jgi:hypothetical protein
VLEYHRLERETGYHQGKRGLMGRKKMFVHGEVGEFGSMGILRGYYIVVRWCGVTRVEGYVPSAWSGFHDLLLGL